MFGYVTASYEELTNAQRDRYGAVYCGICRDIRIRSGNLSRLTLSYDMAFLALLQMSLYEPEDISGKNGCLLHPVKRRPWIDNDCVQYAADMNVALAYYKMLDDWQDDGKYTAKLMADAMQAPFSRVENRYPRQCRAIRVCIEALSRLEAERCDNPDTPAGVFGQLMAELMVWQEDLWEDSLRELGFHLGRFVYLLDAMLDYGKDLKTGSYNPFAEKKETKDPVQWEQYLVLAMSRCTESFEKLPLVQDKDILDNILYSGVWVQFRAKMREEEPHGSGSL